jgi:hypothetical protein
MGNYLMSDIEKIEAVLFAAAEVELNLGSEYGRKILAEKIKSALDNDDTNDTRASKSSYKNFWYGRTTNL